jgi:hypothetical protein
MRKERRHYTAEENEEKVVISEGVPFGQGAGLGPV